MKLAEKVTRAVAAAKKEADAIAASVDAWPETIVETVIYHRLHLSIRPSQALPSFHRLQEEFVDWNELRVSTIREIREQLPDGGDSLDTAVFLKDFLELVFRARQRLDLEFLREANISDVRKFLRQVRGIDPATVEMVLLRSRGHPVVPLNPDLEALVVAGGAVGVDGTRDRKAKTLFEKLPEEGVLPFHHTLLEISRELGPLEDQTLTGCKTTLRSAFAPHLKAARGGSRKAAAKGS